MKKLVAYITTGYPSLEFTKDLALALSESGVDKLELGMPFSDPVADGSVIEKVNLEAIKQGYKIAHTLEVTKEISAHIDTYWMGYFNAFFNKGMEYFIAQADALGAKGFIIPDLPHEEASLYKPQMGNISLIDFVAPTDSPERIKLLTKEAKDFIYLVAYAGITGSDKNEDISHVIANIKASTNTPVYIGFGVNAQTAKQKAQGVDGVIVGTAFIKILMQDLTNKEKIARISSLAKEIKDTINS